MWFGVRCVLVLLGENFAELEFGAYTAVLVRDRYFVGIIKSWFDRHAEKYH